jgi:hypothetical protein
MYPAMQIYHLHLKNMSRTCYSSTGGGKVVEFFARMCIDKYPKPLLAQENEPESKKIFQKRV